MAAHTVVVSASEGEKITGRQADVILAAYWAVQAALRLLKSGSNVSLQLTRACSSARNGLSGVLYTAPVHLNTCKDQRWQLATGESSVRALLLLIAHLHLYTI